MALTLNDITFLASPSGETLLERLAGEDLSDANTLKLVTQLRKGYTPEQVRAALEMARLRLKAVDKFGDAARRMFFTREALEQASDPQVRQYRARRLAAYAASVVDAGCGIGADSLAFASIGMSVLGLDIDPVRVEIARYNAAALGLVARFAVADVRAGLPEADTVFFDPARRDERGNRLHDVERYIPSLSLIRGWSHPVMVVKLSPGVELAQVEGYGGQVEFISSEGDLKEAVLWRGADFAGLRATLLADGEEYYWDNNEYPGRGEPPVRPYNPNETGLSTPRGWLVEPDPALIRAGLVRDAAARYQGYLLDETIAYFTTDVYPDSPWLRAWKILDWMPFNLKKLRAYLHQRGVGNVTVKKRGTAVTPDDLIPKLKLAGDEARTLVLTRCRGQQIVMVCEVMPGESQQQRERAGGV
ncbi:MAG: methyltransferase domain-containing protein [Chloroflexi bacterium]|nr:methyltransferase domain-containing protein [Chloroflexota bacterium]